MQIGDNPEEVVYARATAGDKLRIVRELQASGEVVAMTGDGVNDAPALREAHIGIAMGLTGAEVTREAAAMILADDNFASIVAAIHEGRGIYDNIQKTLVYLLGGNLGELLVMFVALLAGLPLPLLPLQLLWIKMLTDGLPAIALVMDPLNDDALARPPRDPKEQILGRAQWENIALIGALQALVTLGVFVWALRYRDEAEARDLAFSVLVFGEVLRSFASRSSVKLFWEVGALSNQRLLMVVLISAGLQVAIHYLPYTPTLLGVGILPARDRTMAVGVGLVPVSALELNKLFRRWRVSR